MNGTCTYVSNDARVNVTVTINFDEAIVEGGHFPWGTLRREGTTNVFVNEKRSLHFEDPPAMEAFLNSSPVLVLREDGEDVFRGSKPH